MKINRYEFKDLQDLALFGGMLSASMVQQGLTNERTGIVIDKRWNKINQRTWYAICDENNVMLARDWTPRGALQGFIRLSK